MDCECSDPSIEVGHQKYSGTTEHEDRPVGHPPNSCYLNKASSLFVLSKRLFTIIDGLLFPD
jgi:hypothetical protein